MDRISQVWRYFEKKDDKAVCSLCGKVLLIKGSSTSGLIRHLQSIHEVTVMRASIELKKKVQVKKIPKRETKHSPNEQNFKKVYIKECFDFAAADDGGDTQVTCNESGNNEDALADDDEYVDFMPLPQQRRQRSEQDVQLEMLNVMREIGEDIKEQRTNLMETDQELLSYERKRFKLMQEFVKHYKKQTDILHEYLRKK